MEETQITSRNESNTKEVINLEGETVNPDEELSRGVAGSRSGSTILRKAIKGKNIRTMRNIEGLIIIHKLN